MPFCVAFLIKKYYKFGEVMFPFFSLCFEEGKAI